MPGEGYDRLGYEFRLYLPLYNEVEWIEVGIDSAARFEWLPLREERPVVAYGTSILQGGCASRPGMAWTNILSRKIDRTVMNFGFSGSGRMERETVELIAENDAKAWIIDCVPNMNHLEDFVVRSPLSRRRAADPQPQRGADPAGRERYGIDGLMPIRPLCARTGC